MYLVKKRVWIFCVWFRFLDLISLSLTQALSLRLKNLFFLVLLSLFHLVRLRSSIQFILNFMMSFTQSLVEKPLSDLIWFDLWNQRQRFFFPSLSKSMHMMIIGHKNGKGKILLILNTDLWWIVVWGNLPSYFHITLVLNQSACYQHQHPQILWSLPNIPY